MGVTEPDCGDWWVGTVVPVNPDGGVELGVPELNTRRVVRGVRGVRGVRVLRVVNRGVVPCGGGGVA